MGFFGGKKQILALDVGSHSIKYALLQNTGKALKVVMAGQRPVPPQGPNAGELEGPSLALKALVGELDLIKKKLHQVIFALPSSLAIVRYVKLPPTPMDRVRAILRSEAEQHIPFSIDDVAMDINIIKSDDKGVEAVICAIKQEKVDDYVHMVTVAGLSPEIIDVSAFALFNIFRFVEGEKLQALAQPPASGEGPAEEPTVALLDLGASTTDISVCSGNRLMLTRSVAISGNSLSDAVARRLSCSPVLAERYKRQQARARTETEEKPEEKKGLAGPKGMSRPPAAEGAPVAPKISLGGPKAPDSTAAPKAPAAPATPVATSAPKPPAVPPTGGLPLPGAPSAPKPPAAPDASAVPIVPPAGGLPLPGAPSAPKPPAVPVAPAAPPAGGLPLPGAPSAPKPPAAPAVPPSGGLPLPAAPSVSTEGGMKPPAPAAPKPPAAPPTGGLPLPAPPVSTEGGMKPPAPAAPKPPAAPAAPLTGGLPLPAAPSAPKPPAAPAAPLTGGLPLPAAPSAPKPPAAPAPPPAGGLPLPAAPSAPKPPAVPAPPVSTEGGMQSPAPPATADAVAPPPPPAGGFRLGSQKPAPAAPPIPPGMNKMQASKLSGDQSATGGSGLRIGRPKPADGSQPTGGGLRIGTVKAKEEKTPDAPDGSAPDGTPPPGGNSLGAAKAEEPAASPAGGEDEDATKPLDDKREEIESAIKPMLDRLVGELKRSFDYYKSQISNEDIKKMYLCGGGAQLNDLALFLQQKTGLEVEVLNPLGTLSADGVDLGVELGAVLGLGLRAVGHPCAVNVNLLPADIAIRKREQSKQRNITVMAVMGGALALELAFSGYWIYTMRSDELTAVQTKLDGLQAVVRQVEELKKTRTQLERRKNLILNLTLDRARWLDVLTELQSILERLSQPAWCTSLQFSDKNTCSLAGMTTDFKIVGELNGLLKNSPYFVIQGFPSPTTNPDGLVAFTFSLKVKQAPFADEQRAALEAAQTATAEGAVAPAPPPAGGH